jgi:hypothetical protein
MPHRRFNTTMAGLCCILALAACDSGGGGGGSGASADVKSPFPQLSTAAKTTYVNTRPDGSSQTLYGEVDGTKEIAGRPFQRMVVARQSGSTDGSVEVWANPIGTTAIELGGGAYTLMQGSPLPVPAYASGTAKTPVMISLDPPVGEPQPFMIEGTGVMGDPTAEPTEGMLQGTYTLEATDVTVETPSGTIGGCKHFSVETMLPDLFGDDMPVQADVYAHPQLGVVKADMKSPLEGLGAGMSGATDVSEIGGGLVSVQRMMVLGEGADTNFALSTYDAHQEFDADKDVHAKMLLEVRWADDEKAKSSDMPFLNLDFGTDTGSYSASLMQSPVSVFFPAEKGYQHWIAFVDQAAKNQAINGISYHINASYESDFSPVRVAARIVYSLYNPGGGTAGVPQFEFDGGGF